MASLNRGKWTLLFKAVVFTAKACVRWCLFILSEGWLISATVSTSVLQTPLSSLYLHHAGIISDPAHRAGYETEKRRDLL